MLNSTVFSVMLITAGVAAASDSAPDNPVLRELLEKGVRMSDGKAYKLPPRPVLPPPIRFR